MLVFGRAKVLRHQSMYIDMKFSAPSNRLEIVKCDGMDSRIGNRE